MVNTILHEIIYNRIVICVRLLDNDFVIEYNVGSQTTEQTAQGDTMSIMDLKNKLFNDKYREELDKCSKEIDMAWQEQELDEQELEISNDVINVDDLTDLDDIDIQKYCMEQEAYESLDSLDSFNYMEI